MFNYQCFILIFNKSNKFKKDAKYYNKFGINKAWYKMPGYTE